MIVQVRNQYPIGRYEWHYGKKHLFEMCEIQTDMVSRGSSLDRHTVCSYIVLLYASLINCLPECPHIAIIIVIMWIS